MLEEEGPKEWEIKDEEPPEGLRRKWEREEAVGPQTVICRSCKKETSAESLSCIFCGAEILPEIRPVACFLNWIKQLFRKG